MERHSPRNLYIFGDMAKKLFFKRYKKKRPLTRNVNIFGYTYVQKTIFKVISFFEVLIFVVIWQKHKYKKI